MLDTARPAATALPEIVESVGNKRTVLADSGVRRGAGVVKALALGAKAVLVGQSVLYGAAESGADGAHHALAVIRDELERTLALTGQKDLAAVADLLAP